MVLTLRIQRFDAFITHDDGHNVHFVSADINRFRSVCYSIGVVYSTFWATRKVNRVHYFIMNRYG